MKFFFIWIFSIIYLKIEWDQKKLIRDKVKKATNCCESQTFCMFQLNCPVFLLQWHHFWIKFQWKNSVFLYPLWAIWITIMKEKPNSNKNNLVLFKSDGDLFELSFRKVNRTKSKVVDRCQRKLEISAGLFMYEHWNVQLPKETFNWGNGDAIVEVVFSLGHALLKWARLLPAFLTYIRIHTHTQAM